jgi:type III restriction enzyme
MLITWHVLNKLANPQDARFSDTFLIVTPGITIRDRLRVLFPNDPNNYYRQRDILPSHRLKDLEKAKILITNFHAFKAREKMDAPKLTKELLSKGEGSPFKETPEEIARRVCRGLGNKRNIIIINDEAHHCYRRKADESEVKLKGEERKEQEKRDEEGRIWINGLEAVKEKFGIKAIYDLSATPFFLRGSGFPEATLFGWVVSDFSLIDAIESGIVKVPRVPVSDDQVLGDLPTYRNLWYKIRDQLPRKGRGTEPISDEPRLPKELQGALHSLYGNYEKHYRLWENNAEARAKGQTPPVFIVVCNNTNVSKLVYDYISGWEKEVSDSDTVVVPGALPIFDNSENGAWRSRPNSILIDSEQLESGEAMNPDFKKIADREIEEFKNEYRIRFPERDVEKIADEDLLREVLNTVGKAGKLGEHVKCVVSVSMLTEGWDANTVTHILGVRAFGTQLLCEQVVGRGLRRMSYATNGKGWFDPEYAEVYGVPFSFIPCSGSPDPKPGPTASHVRALEERIACEIQFPRVMGYKYEFPNEHLAVNFTEASRLVLSTADVATIVDMKPIVGESSIHTLDDLKRHRAQEVAFLLAKLTLEKYFRDEDNVRSWLFPQLLAITKQWLSECVSFKDNTFPQLLLLFEFAHDGADRIYKAIVESTQGSKTLMPILHPYDTLGSTKYVNFDTVRPVYSTHPDKCHINYVVADTDSWEQKMAQSLEDMDEVVHYVKNHNLGFTIPYTIGGREKQYVPDFIAKINDNEENLLNLIIEVSGENKKDKAAKVSTAQTLWIPAINNHGGFGRWAFIEITDPWNAKNIMREALSKYE